MKLLFVLPNIKINNKIRNFIIWINQKLIFGFGKSLAFPILTALTDSVHDIEFVEGGHSEIDYTKNYDLVGITSVTRYAPLAYEIADEMLKAREQQ